MKKKWCSAHQCMEPVSRFQKNCTTKDGKQNVCAEVLNSYMNSYYYDHKDALIEKQLVYYHFRNDHITEEQKNKQIRSINKRYGISSRI